MARSKKKTPSDGSAKSIPDFKRASRQRLTNAELIFEKLGLNLEAAYIAGYAAECAMKAAILAKTPEKQREKMAADICKGNKGHDLEWLKELLDEKGAVMPENVSDHFERVRTWSTDLRYEVGHLNTRTAREFIKSVREVVEWAERSYQ